MLTDGRTDRQTGRQTDMTKLIVACCNFANATKVIGKDNQRTKGIRICPTKEGRQPDESNKIRIRGQAKGSKIGGRVKRCEEEKTMGQVTTETLPGNLKNRKVCLYLCTS